MLLLQPFPFPSTLGEVTLHQLSQACVFIYGSHGKWVFPPLLWSFPLTATFTSFPTPDCWEVPLLLPSPAGLLWGIFPPPSSALRAPRPLCYMSFLLLLLIIQFFFFFPSVGVGLSWGLCWSGWSDCCGSTICCLAHLAVHTFPSHLGAAIYQWHGSPPGFSVSCEVEMLCTGWRCGGVKVSPLFGGFPCKVYLQCLSEILL
jgi:hypothetical protein